MKSDFFFTGSSCLLYENDEKYFLFKVLPIASYTFSQRVPQFVDVLAGKKLLLLQGQYFVHLDKGSSAAQHPCMCPIHANMTKWSLEEFEIG